MLCSKHTSFGIYSLKICLNPFTLRPISSSCYLSLRIYLFFYKSQLQQFALLRSTNTLLRSSHFNLRIFALPIEFTLTKFCHCRCSHLTIHSLESIQPTHGHRLSICIFAPTIKLTSTRFQPYRCFVTFCHLNRRLNFVKT